MNGLPQKPGPMSIEDAIGVAMVDAYFNGVKGFIETLEYYGYVIKRRKSGAKSKGELIR